MSNERLRAKLVDAGHDKADIDLTEREELLDLFGNLLAQTQAVYPFRSRRPPPWMIIYHPMAVLVVIPN